ncbi:MAG: hypothetical protein HY646_12370 [Acidobacteria bacterium]|nr:hypothetical protein [Acidobacteriota bacterium]
MDYRRRLIWTSVAIVVVLTISALSTPGAQAQARGQQPAYRPAADAKDLRAVLFNWTWYMGMLRGADEHELVATLEYQGKGAIQVDGQPCTLTKYRISNNYQTSGERIQYTCTRANGQTYSNIEGGNRGSLSDIYRRLPGGDEFGDRECRVHMAYF